jgi:hypothetical protein
MSRQGQNYFVPGGGAPAAWGGHDQPDVNVPMPGNDGRANRYAANNAPDRQEFDGPPRHHMLRLNIVALACI